MSPKSIGASHAIEQRQPVVSGDTFRRVFRLRRLGADDGQTLVEYGLIIALVAITIVLSLETIANIVTEIFDAVTAAIDAVIP